MSEFIRGTGSGVRSGLITRDPEHDSKSIYYQPENILSVSSSDVGWIAGIAAVVLAVAWFGGLIRPKEQNDEQPTPSTPQP